MPPKGPKMQFADEKLLNDFDVTINKYLVFLVHTQRSALIQVSDKIAIFDKAKKISVEIKANVQKTLDNISEYNVEEKREYIKEILLKIETVISNEINNHKKVKINDDVLFLLNDIIENLTTDVNGVKLFSADISNMYSYKELNVDREQREYIYKEIGKIKEKLNVDLKEIKSKAFLGMLYRKNKNPERYYKVNNFILEKCKSEEIKLFVSTMPGNRDEGLFFIINKRDLTIRRKSANGLIEYTIRFIDFEDQFNISIAGKISVNESEELFAINETYPNAMRGSVVNAFNIREIIELFNLLYARSFSEKRESENNNNDIDNYLDGKIKNN
jgi:hypothetical protein